MSKKLFLIALLALIFATPTIFAAEEAAPPTPKKPDFTLPKLKFETSDEVCMDIINTGNSKIPGARYIARYNIDTWGGFRTGDGWAKKDGLKSKSWSFLYNYEKRILRTPIGMKLSSKQKELISKGYNIVILKGDSGISTFYALGVDKEQAQNTAIAFVQYLTEEAEKNYRALEKQILTLENKYHEILKQGEPYPEKIKAATKKFEQIKRDTHYQQHEDAFRAIERMNVIFETKMIDLAVLVTKRKTIEKELTREKALKAERDAKQQKYDRQPLILKLEELRIDISIALSEVEATLEAAGRIRNDAEKYIKYQNEFNDINGKHKSLRNIIDNAHNELLSAKREIEHPHKKLIPPKVIDNKVFLQPIMGY